MKIIQKHIWKTILSVGISVLVVIYIYANRTSIFGSFAHIEPVYLVVVFAGQVGVQIANAYLLQTQLRPFGKSIHILESLKLTVVSSFVNFFTPVVGGASLRAVYLKRAHSLSYASFVGVLYAYYLMFFAISFLIGMIGLAATPGSFSQTAGQVAALFFSAGIVASILFMAFGHKLIRAFDLLPQSNRYARSFTQKIHLIDDGWSVIRHDSRTVISMGLWAAAATFCVALVYWSALHSLGIDGTVWTAIIFASLAIVGLLFNITPGSVGIREAVYAGMYSITMVNPKQVVAFSLIDRPAQLLVITVGWILFGRSIIAAIPSSKQEN